MNNEETQEKFEQLASAIDWIKTKLVDLQEEKGLAPVKTPYEVEVPEDIENYSIMGYTGYTDSVKHFPEATLKRNYIRGLVFKTKEEAERYDRERILLFKMHKWAEEQNGGWIPNWGETFEAKYCLEYNNYTEDFIVDYYSGIFTFSKLPYFKSKEIAEQFIEEFGDEIKEVLC